FAAQRACKQIRTIAQFLCSPLNALLGGCRNVASQRCVVEYDGNRGRGEPAFLGYVTDRDHEFLPISPPRRVTGRSRTLQYCASPVKNRNLAHYPRMDRNNCGAACGSAGGFQGKIRRTRTERGGNFQRGRSSSGKWRSRRRGTQL